MRTENIMKTIKNAIVIAFAVALLVAGGSFLLNANHAFAGTKSEGSSAPAISEADVPAPTPAPAPAAPAATPAPAAATTPSAVVPGTVPPDPSNPSNVIAALPSN
jgi:hypothetical protein